MQRLSKKTVSSRCITERRSGIWLPCLAIPYCMNREKVASKAVIPMKSPDGSPLPYRIFDPCIWKKDGIYYSLSGGTLPDGPSGVRIRANFSFRSTDLANWEYLHPFVLDDRFTLVGDDGACPYFWPIGDQHMLLFFSHMSDGQYLLGTMTNNAISLSRRRPLTVRADSS